MWDMWGNSYDYDALDYLEGRCMDNVIEDGKQCYPVYDEDDYPFPSVPEDEAEE